MTKFTKEARIAKINDILESSSENSSNYTLLTQDSVIMLYPDEWFEREDEIGLIFHFDPRLLLDEVGRDIIDACVQKTRDNLGSYLNSEVRTLLAEFWQRLDTEERSADHRQLLWLLNCPANYLHPSTDYVPDLSKLTASARAQAPLKKFNSILTPSSQSTKKQPPNFLNLLNEFLFQRILGTPVFPYLTIQSFHALNNNYQLPYDKSYPTPDFKFFVILKLQLADDNTDYTYLEGELTSSPKIEDMRVMFKEYSVDQLLALTHFLEQDYLHHLMMQLPQFAQICLQNPFVSSRISNLQWCHLIGKYQEGENARLLKLIGENKHFCAMAATDTSDALTALEIMGDLGIQEQADNQQAKPVFDFYRKKVRAIEKLLLPVKPSEDLEIIKALRQLEQLPRDNLRKTAAAKLLNTIITTLSGVQPTRGSSQLIRKLLLSRVFMEELLVSKIDDFKNFCDISIEDVVAVMQIRWPFLYNKRFPLASAHTPATVIAKKYTETKRNSYKGLNSLPIGGLPQLHDVNDDDISKVTGTLQAIYLDDLQKPGKLRYNSTTLSGTSAEVYELAIRKRHYTLTLHHPIVFDEKHPHHDTDMLATIFNVAAKNHIALVTLVIDSHAHACCIYFGNKQISFVVVTPGYEDPLKSLITANLKARLMTNYKDILDKRTIQYFTLPITQSYDNDHRIIALATLQDMLASILVSVDPALIPNELLKETPHVKGHPLISFDEKGVLLVDDNGITLHGERDNDLNRHLLVLQEMMERFIKKRKVITRTTRNDDFLKRQEAFAAIQQEPPTLHEVVAFTEAQQAELATFVASNPYINAAIEGYLQSNPTAEISLLAIIDPDSPIYCALYEALYHFPHYGVLSQLDSDATMMVYEKIYIALKPAIDNYMTNSLLTPEASVGSVSGSVATTPFSNRNQVVGRNSSQPSTGGANTPSARSRTELEPDNGPSKLRGILSFEEVPTDDKLITLLKTYTSDTFGVQLLHSPDALLKPTLSIYQRDMKKFINQYETASSAADDDNELPAEFSGQVAKTLLEFVLFFGNASENKSLHHQLYQPFATMLGIEQADLVIRETHSRYSSGDASASTTAATLAQSMTSGFQSPRRASFDEHLNNHTTTATAEPPASPPLSKSGRRSTLTRRSSGSPVKAGRFDSSSAKQYLGDDDFTQIQNFTGDWKSAAAQLTEKVQQYWPDAFRSTPPAVRK